MQTIWPTTGSIKPGERLPRFGDGRDWFFAKRFGLFVHWGLYAIEAWHEQDQFRRRIAKRDYTQRVHRFNPVRFDPEAWLDLAQDAGMQYVCFTTKHVDGFCMWNTAQTDYNVTKTPYRKDILGMLAEACHRRKVPLCLYYSVADMNQKHYPNAGRSYERLGPEEGDEPDVARYLEFVREQVRELCTQYGEIHGFWWDANMIGHKDPEFNAWIRSMQPAAMVNDRGFGPGDFGTPEREYVGAVNEVLAFDRPTEQCQSIGTQSWGYREAEDYFSDRYLARSIDNALAKGGNYLLNVGPRADGTFPPDAVRILRNLGAWYRGVRESFEDAEPASQLTENRSVLLTQKADCLYLHLARDPACSAVGLKPLALQPVEATLLNTGAPVETRVEVVPNHWNEKPYLWVRNLPVNELTDTTMVVRMRFGMAGA
ncbi:MAG: glycoside hydrolase [Lentisphaerae bacterium RIFOXYB12_FULL_65_16]|nr:MAG: glycoside hydrolase [Lentisphaerae bacterium RIFOXYA12_64_32]OGV94020.1 MAG: glycoside hydrolase [Lentisphaerae bacterium RIFOXYB12_FULL_65_16]